MADTIIKIDLNKSPYDQDDIHNRWHPDIPMVAMVKPGDDFIVVESDNFQHWLKAILLK